MPHYYFNVRNDRGLVPDDEGLEFSDLSVAEREALTSLVEMAKDKLRRGERRIAVEIVDAHRTPVFEAALTLEAKRLKE